MRVLVCGGRRYANRAFLHRVLNRVHARRPVTCVIEGGAAGADAMGRVWAHGKGIDVATFDANWDLYQGRAGSVRNHKMLREGRPELVVAFEGGKGTAHMVRIAREAGVPVVETWKYEQ